MSRISIEDLRSPDRSFGEPFVKHRRTRPGEPADVTLVNFNLMLVNLAGQYDQQNYVPLGVLYIAATLEKQGYNVELIDYQLFSHARCFDVELFLDAVGAVAPLVGFSCMSNLLPLAILCAESLKRRQPGCRIVLGGVGPSPVAEHLVEAFPFVDAVVEGEGELTMLDFAEGRVVPLPPRKIPKDLDALPLPAYSLLDYDDYLAAPSMITSRGCPHQCTFCTEPHNFGGCVRFRNVESIVEELELVHALSGRTVFLFQDDILPMNRSRFHRLARAFRELSFPIRWKCFARVDLMDRELMREMLASGCVQIRYGIESGSNKTLKRIKKGFTIEKAFEVTEESLRHFPSVHVAFIWGYPFEDVEQFEATLEWVARFERAGASVLMFEYSPLPGSALYWEFHEGIQFSQNNYSTYVVTGHEVVTQAGYAADSDHNRVYSLISEHPRVFSGFYHYENKLSLEKRHRLRQYNLSRRTPVKNEYDL